MTGEIIRCSDVCATDLVAMRALMEETFRGFDPSCFDQDLVAKPWVILLRDISGRVAGFSTLDLMSTVVRGRCVRAVYSGDTVISPRHRATTALPRAFLRFLACHTSMTKGDEDWYWFYVCKGFRTYRFLPVFYQKFYPHPDAGTPDFEQMVMDSLARKRFGDHYDRAQGVVRVVGDYALASAAADLAPERMADPFVRLFVSRNPGWMQGEELVCLARLDVENLRDRPRQWLLEEMEGAP